MSKRREIATGRRLLLVCATALAGALGACAQVRAFDPAAIFTPATAGNGTAVAGAVEGALPVEDVEAPDLFATAEPGLWDGRPSLGGVWVAHPDVDEPLRVRVRNQLNGQSVTGALFRRERDNPGPSLQVSSDAAAALDILAGAPTPLQVTALRKKAATDRDAAQPDRPTDKAGAGGLGTDPVVSAVAAPTETPERLFVQAGVFTAEENAARAVALLQNAGVSGSVVRSGAAGSPAWRVIAGPAATREQRDTTLEKVRAAGFDDAYPVSD